MIGPSILAAGGPSLLPCVVSARPAQLLSLRSCLACLNACSTSRSSAVPGRVRPRAAAARLRALPGAHLLQLADQLMSVSTAAPGTFEAQLDPSIAVAASFAALPPILFWIRVALAEQRRQSEVAQKERARLELKRKLFGDR